MVRESLLGLNSYSGVPSNAVPAHAHCDPRLSRNPGMKITAGHALLGASHELTLPLV